MTTGCLLMSGNMAVIWRLLADEREYDHRVSTNEWEYDNDTASTDEWEYDSNTAPTLEFGNMTNTASNDELKCLFTLLCVC